MVEFRSRLRHADGSCAVKEDGNGDKLFAAPGKRTQFCFRGMRADIRQVDQRFVELLRWLGTNGISVRLSGQDTPDGYAVYKICEIDTGSGTKLSAEDGFLQYVISRLLETKAPELSSQGAGAPEEDEEADSDEMKLTSLQSMTDFLDCARSALPANIRKWARRNLAIAKSSDVSQEEKRHAQHALSLMLNIRWKDSYFGAIDPDRARRILDEELYGMEKVKQRIIETIIQINRTHTLPAYGLLLVGPAGTGKSQIAYAVARILGLPWTSLDMSSIHDPEQLTGSSRVYSNAKPGSIMEAFSLAGESNLVFIINELDKADSKDSTGSPADALLTLLDNLGFTDNYMECTIPTAGVYPIATANDKSRISEPLLTRFAVIDIPDYTPEEKKADFPPLFSAARAAAHGTQGWGMRRDRGGGAGCRGGVPGYAGRPRSRAGGGASGSECAVSDRDGQRAQRSVRPGCGTARSGVIDGSFAGFCSIMVHSFRAGGRVWDCSDAIEKKTRKTGSPAAAARPPQRLPTARQSRQQRRMSRS